MHRWSVGDVEVVRIEDLDFAMPTDETMPPWAIPGVAASDHEHRVAFSALAIRDGETSIVVDPWLQAARDASDAAERADRLLGRLADAGWPPEEVDAVVNSHLEGVGWSTRPDGDAWVLSFPNARHLYPADEVDAVGRGEPLPGADDFGELGSLTAIEAVSGPLRLTDVVTVEPAPGHSFGHQVVRIDTGDELAIYLGHLVIHPVQLSRPDEHPMERNDPEPARVRRRYLDELAARRGILLTTLIGGDGGGRVALDGDAYRIVPA